MTASYLHLVASSRGGGAVHMQALTAGLAGRGYPTVAVMPLDGGHVEPADFEAAGVRFIPLPYPPAYPGQWVAALARIFKAESPSIIHAHGSRAAFWAYWALRLAGLSKIQLVVTVHGFVTPLYNQPRRFLQLTMERWVAARAAAVIGVSKAERQAVLAAKIAPAAKLFMVYLGFDLSALEKLATADRHRARRQLDVSPDTLLLVTVCRLGRPRDFKTLLAAFHQLVDSYPQDVQLFIVGGGPLQTEIETLVETLNLQNRVKLWGFRRDVINFYAAADMAILTSVGGDGLPITIIEGQAAALPIVASDAGGAKEAFQPDTTGLLVPRFSPEALSQAFLALATNPNRRHQMGQQGRKFATSQFALARMVDQTLEIYQNLKRHQ